MASAPRKVRVSLACNNKRLQIRVTPWSAHVGKPGIVWLPSASITEIRISKRKPGRPWPFELSPPNKAYKGTPARPPRGRKLRPGNEGKTFPYTITLRFRDPAGRTRQAVIDPDMVVDV